MCWHALHSPNQIKKSLKNINVEALKKGFLALSFIFEQNKIDCHPQAIICIGHRRHLLNANFLELLGDCIPAPRASTQWGQQIFEAVLLISTSQDIFQIFPTFEDWQLGQNYSEILMA